MAEYAKKPAVPNAGNLVLTRYAGEKGIYVFIRGHEEEGALVEFKILRARGDRIEVGVNAGRKILVLRQELYEKMVAEGAIPPLSNRTNQSPSQVELIAGEAKIEQQV